MNYYSKIISSKITKSNQKNHCLYQNLEYGCYKDEEKQNNLFGFVSKFKIAPPPEITSSSENEEFDYDERNEHTPTRSISDNKLWKFTDRSLFCTEKNTKSPAISPFIPIKLKSKVQKSDPVLFRSMSTNDCFSNSSTGPHKFLFTPSPPAPQYNHYPSQNDLPSYKPSPSISQPQAIIYNQPIYIPLVTNNIQWNPTNTTLSLPNGFITGRLKFFDETQQYGFFILDHDGTDLFVHYDDLMKSGISISTLQQAKIKDYHFMFQCMSYYGKYQLSRKAVNIKLLNGNNSGFNLPNNFANNSEI